jgi:hypothetical protein
MYFRGGVFCKLAANLLSLAGWPASYINHGGLSGGKGLNYNRADPMIRLPVLELEPYFGDLTHLRDFL